MNILRKNFVISLISVSLCLLLCGCAINQNQMLAENENNGDYSSSDYDKLTYISAKVKDDKAEYTFIGDYVVIEYEYEIDGARSFGLKILCDGVETPFHTNLDKEDKVLQIIKNTGEKFDIKLFFIPIGRKGDNVSIDIIDIVEPDYYVGESGSNPSNPFKDQEFQDAFVWGRKYENNHLSGINVSMEQDGLQSDVSYYNKYQLIPLQEKEDTEDEKERNLESLYSSSTIQKSLYYTFKRGEKLNIEIEYTGTYGSDIITCFYVNNELLPIWDGNYYAKTYVDNTHYSMLTCELDTSSLEKGRYICYFICSGVLYNNNQPGRFILDVK